MAVTLRANVALQPIGIGPLEPSVALTGSDAFYTAGQILYLSKDGGKTFAALRSAGSVFPEGFKAGYGDQSAIWSPNRGRVVWAMIFKPGDGSSTRVRIAYTSAAKAAKQRGARRGRTSTSQPI
jgi:hypothetical protein